VTPEEQTVQIGDATLRVIRVSADADQRSLVATLTDAGLDSPTPVVALVGGAGGLEPRESAVCARLLSDAVVPVLEKTSGCLVDGGTAAGIMALAGKARRDAGASGPHVGVVAEGTVKWPGLPQRPDAAELDPNHTHVVVVPGDTWGDEAPWLSRIATTLAGSSPSVTVLANGGPIAYDDVRRSVAARRPVLVLAGTGRTAAEIAAARAGSASEPRATAVAASSLVTVVPDDPTALIAELTRLLRPSET
jgi:SLOG in TRPM, prokaryote